VLKYVIAVEVGAIERVPGCLHLVTCEGTPWGVRRSATRVPSSFSTTIPLGAGVNIVR
jgi:hypothetical protein